MSSQKLDAVPWSGWHVWITILLGMGFTLDALESTVPTMALRSLEEEFGIGEVQATAISASFTIGALVGSLVSGFAADKIGRRPVFIWGLAMYCLATMLNSIIRGYTAMLVLRFLVGCSLGGETSTVYIALSEFIPAAHRGRVGVLLNTAWDFWATVASFAFGMALQRDLISPHWTSRLGMTLGASLGCLTLLGRLRIPESPRWLASVGRESEADALIEQLESSTVREMLQKTFESLSLLTRRLLLRRGAGFLPLTSWRDDDLPSRHEVKIEIGDGQKSGIQKGVTVKPKAVSPHGYALTPALPPARDVDGLVVWKDLSEAVRNANFIQIACMIWRVCPLPLIYAAMLNVAICFSTTGFVGYAELELFPLFGIDEIQGSYVIGLAMFLAIFVNLFASHYIETIGRKVVVPAALGTTAIVSIPFFFANPSFFATSAAGATYILFFTAVWKVCEAPAANCAQVSTGEVFPVALSSAGIGITHALGRLVGAVSQTALVQAHRKTNSTFLPTLILIGMYSAALAVCAVWHKWGVETAGRSLDENNIRPEKGERIELVQIFKSVGLS